MGGGISMARKEIYEMVSLPSLLSQYERRVDSRRSKPDECWRLPEPEMQTKAKTWSTGGVMSG
jgi:hypothetical protein